MVTLGQSVDIFQQVIDGIDVGVNSKALNVGAWVIAELVNMGLHQDCLPQIEVKQDHRRKLYQAKENILV